MEAEARLDALLAEYDDAVAALARHVVDRVDARLPGAHRMVYDNYNALVVGYSPDGRARHAVCSVAAYPRWVNLFFFVGPDLADPHGLLRGTGSTVRNVKLTDPADYDRRVAALLDAAVERWEWPFDSSQPTTTEIVSVSATRPPRRPRRPG